MTDRNTPQFPADIYHRGLREKMRQPNSFEAILRANAGDMLEMDIAILADGTLAIVHPTDVKAQSSRVEDLSLSDFENLNAPNEDGSHLEVGRKLPLFKEVALLAADREVKLMIEIKGASLDSAIKAGKKLVEEMVAIIKEGAIFNNSDYFEKDFIIESFSDDALQEVKKELVSQDLNVPLVLSWTGGANYAASSPLTSSLIQKLNNYHPSEDWVSKGFYYAKDKGYFGVASVSENLLPQHVAVAHNLGLKIIGAGTDQEMKRCKEMGIDIFISNNLS